MAQTLLTRESPKIIQFIQNIAYFSKLLEHNEDKYRLLLEGEQYLTEMELSELFRIIRRTLGEHRNTGERPFYRFGRRILHKEKDIIQILKNNRMEVLNKD